MTEIRSAKYQDPSLPAASRVEDLLSRMTLEEKIGQLASSYLDTVLENGEFSPVRLQAAVDDLAIGVLHSFRWGVNQDTALQMRVMDEAQRYLVEQTRLGIPAIMTGEGVHGHLSAGATIFPHAIAMASAWDPSLVTDVATVVAREARSAGISQILSPVLDLAREPRWGRTQETYGEDPYLASRMGAAFIRGLQGGGPPIDSEHVAATAKHFAAHGSPESGINLGPVHAGEREIRDTYLPVFRAAIQEAGALSVMPAYHELDGIPCSCSRWLLTEVLRQEWGFEGYTYSDWEAVEMLYTFHRTAATRAEAGQQALEAGMDLEAPDVRCYGRKLLELVQSGRVATETVDTAVRRILRVKFLLGLFENPYGDLERAARVRDAAGHRDLARRVARESLVLLKNDGRVLPLSKDIRRLAVIGPNAATARLGNYTGANDNVVSLLDGIRVKVSDQTAVTYAQGCGVYELSDDGIPEAVQAACEADAVILALGESEDVCNEGMDQHDLELPGRQSDLVRQVIETGTPTVVVLINGRPLAIEWIAGHAGAIVEAWFPGEEGGNAIADVLFGDSNPCGKLPVSLPRSAGHVPSFYNRKPSARGYYHKPGAPGAPGRDYVFSSPNPVYPFGHGLSYTQFEYKNLSVSPAEILPAGSLSVSVSVRNTGSVPGAEVVQLYLTDVVSTVTTPVRALKRFAKVHLAPGEEKRVEFQLEPSDLALLDRHLEWVVEPGEFRVAIGDQSAFFHVAAPGAYHPEG